MPFTRRRRGGGRLRRTRAHILALGSPISETLLLTVRMAQGIDSIGGLGSDSDKTLRERENAGSKRERSSDDDGVLPGLILMPRNLILGLAHGNGTAGAVLWAAMMMMMAAVPRGGNGTRRRLGLGAAMMMKEVAAVPRGDGGLGSAQGDALASVSGGCTRRLRIFPGEAMMMTMMTAIPRASGGSGSD
jgi:hypothetical protein